MCSIRGHWLRKYIRWKGGEMWRILGSRRSEALWWMIVMFYCVLRCHVGALPFQVEQVWCSNSLLMVCVWVSVFVCTSGCFMITCLKMDSWDHRHFPLLTMCHEPGRNLECVCRHIYRLSLRDFDVSHPLSWYYCILALKAMFMVLGLWWEQVKYI